ncbi:hypothetical protein D4L84_09060 [Campylobacter coli]|nr:hypothetical protein D4L84_09060 [Campylobacter coli]
MANPLQYCKVISRQREENKIKKQKTKLKQTAKEKIYKEGVINIPILYMRKLRYRDIMKYTSISCIGEGNGHPLQCSCLENPRDRAAWWAAIHEVAQSRTRLKQLGSSSSK